MHSPWALRLAVTVLAAAAGGVAHADIYSFVDGAGVTHFSNVPVDNRYRLLLATPVEEGAEHAGLYRPIGTAGRLFMTIETEAFALAA